MVLTLLLRKPCLHEPSAHCRTSTGFISSWLSTVFARGLSVARDNPRRPFVLWIAFLPGLLGDSVRRILFFLTTRGQQSGKSSQHACHFPSVSYAMVSSRTGSTIYELRWSPRLIAQFVSVLVRNAGSVAWALVVPCLGRWQQYFTP